MSLPRGFDDDSKPVPTVEPVYFDDVPEAVYGEETREEILRLFCGLLDDGPSFTVQMAALRYCVRYDRRTLRQIAAQHGVSVGNLHAHTLRIREKFGLKHRRREHDYER